MANKSLRRVFWKRNRHCFARSIFVAQSQIFADAPPMSSLEYLGSSTRYPVVQPAILARPWLSGSSRVNFVWTDYHTCFSIIGLQRILSFLGGIKQSHSESVGGRWVWSTSEWPSSTSIVTVRRSRWRCFPKWLGDIQKGLHYTGKRPQTVCACVRIMYDNIEDEDEEEDDNVTLRTMMLRMMMLNIMMLEEEEEDRSHDRNPQFVQACAVEMHMDMSQEPFYAEMYKKNAAPQDRAADFVQSCAVEVPWDMSQELFYMHLDMPRAILCGHVQENAAPQDRDARFARACTMEMHMDVITRAILCCNLQEKCRAPGPRWRLCAILRSRSAFGHVIRAFLCGNVWEKCRAPGPRRRLCAILHSRNALAHVTRAILFGNVQEKCRAPGPRRRLCAILRSRSTLGHVTRAILHAFGHATSHFMRTCTRKCRAPGPRRPFCASLHNGNAHGHDHKSHFMLQFTGKMPRPRTTLKTLCNPARSKCIWTCHKSLFMRKCMEKMPRPRTTPKTLCNPA